MCINKWFYVHFYIYTPNPNTVIPLNSGRSRPPHPPTPELHSSPPPHPGGDPRPETCHPGRRIEQPEGVRRPQGHSCGGQCRMRGRDVRGLPRVVRPQQGRGFCGEIGNPSGDRDTASCRLRPAAAWWEVRYTGEIGNLEEF